MNLTSLSGLGAVLLGAGFAFSLWAVVAYVVGLRSRNGRLLASGRGAILAVAFILTLAVMVLWGQFLGSDFSNRYVAEHSSSDLSLAYRISGLWAGNEGSLLLWAWLLALYTAVATYLRTRDGQELVPYASGILAAVNLFFIFIVNFVSKPFAVLSPVPADGMGLNPLLQDPGMVIHPPTLYLGYVGFAVPFAFAMAALLIGDRGDAWIKATRRWTLVAWLFLSIGIVFGGQWAYVVLGWGGYWGWDPVENASLLPWLTGTAFLHSVMIQERRGMLKGWNMGLVTGTFLLTVFGTYLTRSGVVASVHAFGDNALGLWFLAFMVTTLIAAAYLIATRLPLLREDHQFEAVISKESSFLLNNVILVGLAFAVWFGTMYPKFSQWLSGEQVAVGADYYNSIAAPIGTALILLVGVCPLIPWRKASAQNLLRNLLIPAAVGVGTAAVLFALGLRRGTALTAFGAAAFVFGTIGLEFVRGLLVRVRSAGDSLPAAAWNLVSRNRRRWGGYTVHIAIILMIIGIVGSNAYQQSQVVTVTPGQTMSIGGYSLKYSGLQRVEQGRAEIVFADLKVERGGKVVSQIRSQKEFYANSEEPTTRVGILGGYKEDLYVILNGWEADQTANFKLVLNPLIAWIWIGWYVLTLGTLFAAWPAREAAAAVSRRQQDATVHTD